MNLQRSSGVLLHPTSLPGRFGIGDLGVEAYRFVDFLAGAGQGHWQIMPLGPTGYGDSPYQCLSAFAGNTLLVSPDLLDQMVKTQGEVPRRLNAEAAKSAAVEKVHLDEKTFRWMHNQDQMAVEKLSDGIRKFYADARKLEKYALSKVK